MSAQPPEAGPSPRRFASVFRVYEVREEGDQLLYFGDPVANQDRLIQTVWPLFRDDGYEVSLDRRTGEFVLVAEPVDVSVDGVPWTNLFLLVATVLTTLFAGAAWYYVPFSERFSLAVLRALPFTLAVLGVLGIHELGHYLMSRYHKVEASLPYFIPFPTLFGTMGAVIRMKGQMPDRKALFDIGVAGPLAGLAATIVVAAIGLQLPPIEVPARTINAPPGQTIEVVFGYPLLLQWIAEFLGEPLRYPADPTKVVNPVVIGAWVGMFVTFLNLIPVGQLDGGHVLRSILGPAHERIAAFVPAVLFGLAGYVYFVRGVENAAGLWVIWGLIALVLTGVGSVRPIDDSGVGTKRVLVGALTFLLGLLCFTPVPIAIVG